MGAVGAGLATKISKLGTLARIGSEVAIDATGSAIGQIIETGTVSLANTTIDVIAGQSVGKLAGNAASKHLAKTDTGKQLTKQADRASRVAKNRKGNRTGRQRARNQQAKSAQSEAAGYVIGRGAAAGGVASQAASKGVQGVKKKLEEQN